MNVAPCAGLLAGVLLFCHVACAAEESDMVAVPGGAYVPFYARDSGRGTTQSDRHPPVAVAGFRFDRLPVTNGAFLAFVRAHPQWSRSRTPAIFADGHYLAHWASDFSLLDPADANRPVTNVSWFAANAYCRTLGKSLPTTDEWEYALLDAGRNRSNVNEQILAWYATPNDRGIAPTASAQSNGYGVRGLVGLIWEWTLDFNSLLAGADQRGDRAQFCGGASLGSADAGDYASFMRWSMRASLKAAYTTRNLGFRCARPL